MLIVLLIQNHFCVALVEFLLMHTICLTSACSQCKNHIQRAVVHMKKIFHIFLNDL